MRRRSEWAEHLPRGTPRIVVGAGRPRPDGAGGGGATRRVRTHGDRTRVHVAHRFRRPARKTPLRSRRAGSVRLDSPRRGSSPRLPSSGSRCGMRTIPSASAHFTDDVVITSPLAERLRPGSGVSYGARPRALVLPRRARRSARFAVHPGRRRRRVGELAIVSQPARRPGCGMAPTGRRRPRVRGPGRVRMSLTLGTELELAGTESVVRAALESQRRRMTAFLAGLDADAWRARRDARSGTCSKSCCTCAARTAVYGSCAATPTRRSQRTSIRAARRTTYVDKRAGEPVRETAGDFAASSETLFDSMTFMTAERPNARVNAVWGVPVDWRLFVAHIFWDAWVHDATSVVPMGEPHERVGRRARARGRVRLRARGRVPGAVGRDDG